MSNEKTIYNLNDEAAGILRNLNTGILGQVFHGEQSTAMIARFEPNAGGRIHKHPHEQWGFVLEGSCIRVENGVETHCHKGDFWVTKGGAMHTVIAGEDGLVLLDLFAPVREDYRQAGAGFGASAYADDQ